jgi:aerobic-type carbon monoxide dehydrogenase small subunit (CoxS/CutS family)
VGVRVPITLAVNGVERRDEVEPRTLLVQYLRDELALTGAHIGRETSQ